MFLGHRESLYRATSNRAIRVPVSSLHDLRWVAEIGGPMPFADRERFRRQLQWKLDGRGKRVKPRVRRVGAIFALILLLLAIGSFALVFGFVVRMGLFDTGNFLALFFLFFGIPIAVQAIARVTLTWLFVRFGWLTPEEGPDFAWMTTRYPPSCWEPFEDDE